MNVSLHLLRIIESAIADEEWRSRTKLEMLQYTAIKWIFVLLVGLSMGTVAFFINTAVENVGGLKFGVTALLMQRGRLVNMSECNCL